MSICGRSKAVSRHTAPTATTDFPVERKNLVARWGPSDETAALILNGYIDVVPPGEREQWDADPFDACIHQDALHRRRSRHERWSRRVLHLCDKAGYLASGFGCFHAAFRSQLRQRRRERTSPGETPASRASDRHSDFVSSTWAFADSYTGPDARRGAHSLRYLRYTCALSPPIRE